MRTVYVTLGGYSRRWLPPGALGENADVGGGNVYKSTDAGQTFRDISGDLPDIPANWTVVRNGQLVVATNLGVYVSNGTDGGPYELLGSDLPLAPVFTLELKPKAAASEPDTLIAATQGRGVYRYEFSDPVKQPGPGRPGPGDPPGSGPGPGPGGTTGGAPSSGLSAFQACVASRTLRSASATATGTRGLRIAFSRTVRRPVQVDVFQQSIGRRVVGERLVARFADAAERFRWNGRANRPGRSVRDGTYMVRYRMATPGGTLDTRRIVLLRRDGRFRPRPGHFGRESCRILRTFKLERPVFGGANRKSLGIAYRLAVPGRVTVTIRRGDEAVRRYRARDRAPDRTYRLRLTARQLRRRGDYRVTVRVISGEQRQTRTLTSRRL
jgi:hypothetical protein